MDGVNTFPPTAPPPPRSRLASRLALVAWSAMLLVGAAYLLAAHVAPLPQPAHEVLAADVAVQRRPDERGQWLALHALYADCGCSQRVVEHLLARRPLAGVKERVLMVGDSPHVAELLAAGYAVDQLDETTLGDRYGFEAAPSFALVDPHGQVRYLGGYTRTKQGNDFVDVSATRAALRGDSVTPYPVLGCAISRQLKERRDPLGLL